MTLTHDEVETIRIHMNAFKENLCNQCRWKEAEEYQTIVDKLDDLMTVEAIPVEWINKRLDDLNEYIDEHGENHMVLSKIQEAICLSRLLADWQEQRKEE